MDSPTCPTSRISLDAAMDELLAGRWPPVRWQRILDDAELPWRFERLVHSLRADTWLAYTDGIRMGFAVGKFVGAPHEDTGVADLMLSFYDEAAQICAAGVWLRGSQGCWTLQEVVS